MSEPIQAMVARAEAVSRRGAEVRERAKRSVVRWEWWTVEAMLDRPQPLVRERCHGPKRVRERAAPVDGESAEGYGFDATGRIVWTKTVYAGAPATLHRYSAHEPDGVEVAAFVGEDASGEFTSIVDGRARALARVWSGGSWTERYEYDEHGRLARVAGRVDDGMRPYEFETTVTHDAAGRLSEIVETDTLGFRTVAFRARPPSRRAVVGALAPLLASAVEAAVAAAPPSEPVYALLLHYDESQPIPPTVVWAFEGYRTGVLAVPGASQDWLWNPAAFDRYRALTRDVALHELEPGIAVLAADLEHLDPTGQAAREALQLACRQLNRSDWTALPVTDDFVVTCVDLHLEHFTEDLAASVNGRASRRGHGDS